VVSDGKRNAIECVFYEKERRTSSFENIFNQVEAERTQLWLDAVTVYNDSRKN